MKFHPDKCQVLRITNKKKPIQTDYTIHNSLLSPVNSAKYLGVTIDNKLNWGAHCNAVCNKANSTLAFLQRNLQGCPRSVKEKCFNTFVRPTLDYGCSVWDPHLSNQIDSLEKIQKRAARFVTGNYIVPGPAIVSLHPPQVLTSLVFFSPWISPLLKTVGYPILSWDERPQISINSKWRPFRGQW